jgi:hypothetical protein
MKWIKKFESFESDDIVMIESLFQELADEYYIEMATKEMIFDFDLNNTTYAETSDYSPGIYYNKSIEMGYLTITIYICQNSEDNESSDDSYSAIWDRFTNFYYDLREFKKRLSDYDVQYPEIGKEVESIDDLILQIIHDTSFFISIKL